MAGEIQPRSSIHPAEAAAAKSCVGGGRHMSYAVPKLGVGLGYRSPLYNDIMKNRASIDFLEVITDQYICATPEKVEQLVETGKHFPLIPHSVGMSVGTDMPMDGDYIRRTVEFVNKTDAYWFSDHLCFTKAPDVDIGQLTPLWFTEESVDVVCRNVNQLKEKTNKPFLLENITYYFPIPLSEMSEAQFITRVLEKADCGMLLDVNNVHINSLNIGFDPYEFLKSIPLERVVQLHIAGGTKIQGIIIDTHGSAVRKEVWEIVKFVVANAPVKGILLERDQNYPVFQELVDELNTARQILNQYS
jgi:uncharacterized protein (UPF0276 family)